MKLKSATKTKLYELTYLVAGDMTDSELKKVQQTVQDLVKKHKGTLKSESVWGKQALAYTVRVAGKNHTEAHYVHAVVELATSAAQAFEQGVRLENEVIRHLFVEAEEGAGREVAPAEAAEPKEEAKA